MVGQRNAAFTEERAEVEVLNANLEKLKGITKKIQGSMTRLNTSGTMVQQAIGPIYGNTQKLQIINTNIDRVNEAIDKLRKPLDMKAREERVIRGGPQSIGLSDFLSSLKRTNQALAELRSTNLRSNQQTISELSNLLRSGTQQLEDMFRAILLEDMRPVEPLHYITKQLPFPVLSQEQVSRLSVIHTFIVASANQPGSLDTPTAQIYADIRGSYITTTLQNLAAASINTARKQTADAIYRQGTNGIGTYASGLEGLLVGEYETICQIFAREDWGPLYNTTSQSVLQEFSKLLRDLNSHIKSNLTTDCFLSYEIIDIVTILSSRLESRTGELKGSFADALEPIRDTAKTSLSELLDDIRRRIQSFQTLPPDGSSVPITTETMTRIQTMTEYVAPLSSILASLGDGNWTPMSSTSSSSTSTPTLKSLDASADGRQLFAHYAFDTIDTLLSNLESKGRVLLKGKSLLGVFIANNVAVIERMVRSSDLFPLLSNSTAKIDSWRKKGTSLYLDAWRDPSASLMEVQYTNRGPRPPSGNTGAIDSTAVIKGLSSKDKDAIKEKYKTFNTSFDELVARHRSLSMEGDVRTLLARGIQETIEPLYGRFWDRYHEIDKGKGKYVRYDKAQLGGILQSLA
ncbi:MAG: exocyst complex component exo70 [Pycnora praestabilis]|nr:MAG: exocyst complex component exo70 [Pycnora praestabilis]